MAAEMMGVNTVRTKLLAFALGASFAGVAGAFQASYLGATTSDFFEFSTSILVLIMVILGGIGNIWGVLVGRLALVYIDKTFLVCSASGSAAIAPEFPNPSQFNFLIFGILLVVMMRFRPEGFLPSRQRAAELQRPRPAGGGGARWAWRSRPTTISVGAAGPGRARRGPRRDRREMERRRRPAATMAVGPRPAPSPTTSSSCARVTSPSGSAACWRSTPWTSTSRAASIVVPHRAERRRQDDVLQHDHRRLRPDRRRDRVRRSADRVHARATRSSSLKPHEVTAARHRPDRSRTSGCSGRCPRWTTCESASTSTFGAMVGRHPAPAHHAQRGDSSIVRGDASCSTSSASRGRRKHWARNLPYGDQRRLEIGRALGTRPKLLLLDEPTAGMNASETREMTDFIRSLPRELGLTVLPMTTRMSCSMSSTVRPSSARSLRMKSVISRVSLAFMPAVGSSSSSSLGRVPSARAISSRRWSPYGRLRAQVSGRPLEADQLEQAHPLVDRGLFLVEHRWRAHHGVPPMALEVDAARRSARCPARTSCRTAGCSGKAPPHAPIAVTS